MSIVSWHLAIKRHWPNVVLMLVHVCNAGSLCISGEHLTRCRWSHVVLINVTCPPPVTLIRPHASGFGCFNVLQRLVPLGTRCCCDVESMAMMLIQRRNNVVSPVDSFSSMQLTQRIKHSSGVLDTVLVLSLVDNISDVGHKYLISIIK